MGSDIYVSTAGAIAALRDLDIIANNIANTDTPGYKRTTSIFEVAMETALQTSNGNTVPGGAASSYVGSSGIAIDFAQGPLVVTSSKLDVAINGVGFFEIETPGGLRYTRSGSFRVASTGFLSTIAGHPVVGDGGPIPVGTRPVEILSTGVVVDDEGSEVGRLKLIEFEDLSKLRQTAGGLYSAPDDAGASQVVNPQYSAGFVEGSNVVAVRELSALITVQRAYDIALRSLQTDDRGTEQLLEEFM